MTCKLISLATACALLLACVEAAPALAQPGSTIGIPAGGASQMFKPPRSAKKKVPVRSKSYCRTHARAYGC
jgi:hypothetical protein